MKKSLLFILILCVAAAFVNAQNDTIDHVLFTEWRGDWEYNNYAEITNVGDTAVDLSIFTLYSMNPWHSEVGALHMAPGVESVRLSGMLQPGESFVIVNVSEELAYFEEYEERPSTKPGLLEEADLKIYRLEGGLETEQGIHDSVSVFYWAMRCWWSRRRTSRVRRPAATASPPDRSTN